MRVRARRTKQLADKRGRKIERPHRINREITAQTVRVVDEHSEQMGIMSLAEALAAADSKNLDLVEVAPTATPPVCRLADYGKMRYEAAKNSRKDKSSSKAQQLKEIRCRPNTGEADLVAKTERVRCFIAQGHKVKITVRFRGREMAHPDRGLNTLRNIATRLKEDVRVETQPRQEGRQLSITLVPAKKQG